MAPRKHVCVPPQHKVVLGWSLSQRIVTQIIAGFCAGERVVIVSPTLILVGRLAIKRLLRQPLQLLSIVQGLIGFGAFAKA